MNRSNLIDKIKIAEAHWLAKKCVENLEEGIGLIISFNKNPIKYWAMSDCFLQNINNITDYTENLEFSSLQDNDALLEK